MRHLLPGTLVCVRGERWHVQQVLAHDACAILEAAGAGDGNRGTIARFILPFDDAEPIAAGPSQPRVVRPVVWRHAAAAAITAATPAWTSLRAASSARITLLPYQLEPVLAMTRGAGYRFLLADEVGLGKTIQAGLLIAELLAREPEARVLLVTPAALREQWRDELRDRFSIDADILDAAGLARAAAQLPPGLNPWAITRIAITSIDFVKRPDVIRALEPLVWDLVGFDEAHALSGRSDRAAAAELIAARARRVAAITATPHTGDSRAFERLCALGRLAASEPMLLFRRSRADAGLAGGRRMRLMRVRPTAAEREVHDALDAYARRVWRDAPHASAAAARLAMLVLARRACSSAASLARSVERRLALLTGQSPVDLQLPLPLDEGMTRDDEAPDVELSAPGLPDASAERRILLRILALAHEAAASESKLAALVRLLRRTGEPAIVFTEYRDTLEHLAAVLPLSAARLHGGLVTAERRREARRFTHGDARLLLATDAASEGLNLHYRCRLLVHLEVPWTPLRLEQRTGRVDRLGQTRRVHAIGLVSRATAEESVVAALLRRSGIAEREAPFGPASAGEPAGLATLDLRREAEEEVRRLQSWRQIGGCGAAHDTRPLVTILPPRRARVICAHRVAFVDPSGAEIWATLVGLHVARAGVPRGGPREVRAWFDALVAALREPMRDAEAEIARVLLAQLRAQLRAWVTPLITRERAIREHVERAHGRMAAPLVQPGLFDRRALRHADAQRQLVAQAADAARQRIARLQRSSDARAGDSRLLFVVAV